MEARVWAQASESNVAPPAMPISKPMAAVLRTQHAVAAPQAMQQRIAIAASGAHSRTAVAAGIPAMPWYSPSREEVAWVSQFAAAAAAVAAVAVARVAAEAAAGGAPAVARAPAPEPVQGLESSRRARRSQHQHRQHPHAEHSHMHLLPWASARTVLGAFATRRWRRAPETEPPRRLYRPRGVVAPGSACCRRSRGARSPNPTSAAAGTWQERRARQRP